jgi:hypothetical protein
VKEKGYTLEGARQKLKGGKNELDREAEVAERLMRIRAFLVELKNEF